MRNSEKKGVRMIKLQREKVTASGIRIKAKESY